MSANARGSHKSAGSDTNKAKPEPPKYPVACWRAIKNELGDHVFTENSRCTRVDLLKRNVCPFLAQVLPPVKKRDISNAADQESDESGDENGNAPSQRTVTAFVCGRVMPALENRLPGQNMCEEHYALYLQQCAERQAYAEEQRQAYLARCAERERKAQERHEAEEARHAEWLKRQERRLRAKERFEERQQYMANYRETAENEAPTYVHARDDEIFREVKETSTLSNGKTIERVDREKVFEKNRYYTRFEVADAGFCSYLHTENDVRAFRCIEPLVPNQRGTMCAVHTAAWRNRAEADKKRQSDENESRRAHYQQKQQQQESDPAQTTQVATSYVAVAQKGEQNAKNAKEEKKRNRKQRRAAMFAEEGNA